MSTVSQGVKRTEGYVYNSLHWAFPLAPMLALAVAFGPAPLGLRIALVVGTTVAALAGLSVLHTSLRDADLLPPSGWDAVRVDRLTPVTVVWAVASVATVLLAGSLGWRDLFSAIAVPGYLGGALALPLLALPRAKGRPARPFLVALVAIVLGEAALWGTLSSADPEQRVTQITDLYWVGFAAVVVVGYAQMFLNVLATTRELERARVDGARLAVTEERLRFSRDLHDVFGRTLSAVALKAELGAAQAERGRPEAAETMREVQAIATDALAEVREVVRGYRHADLAAEVAGARSLLEAAGIGVQTVVEGTDLPGPAGRALAWVVREAATNVLRHAQATAARIALSHDGGEVRLEISNDGVTAPANGSGSGLTGLSERMHEIGGTLSAGVRDGWFVVTARVGAGELERLRAAEGSTE